jgi:hypothetical protein
MLFRRPPRRTRPRIFSAGVLFVAAGAAVVVLLLLWMLCPWWFDGQSVLDGITGSAS